MLSVSQRGMIRPLERISQATCVSEHVSFDSNAISNLESFRPSRIWLDVANLPRVSVFYQGVVA